jgi:hypothetical protein
MVDSKECFKCKTVKLLSEFYAHQYMADGHLNKCKECTKNDNSKHRKNNLEKYREYDKKRSTLDHRKKLHNEVNRLWRNADKRRVAAHNAVSRAIKKGDLVRLPCQKCNNSKSLAHHEDYDKKLDVVWLCQPCHKQRHKEINSMLLMKE